MCQSGAMIDVNVCLWETYDTISRLFMVVSPSWLSSVSNLWAVILNIGGLQKKQCPPGICKNPPIPSSDVSAAPFHVGGIGRIYWSCIGLSSSEAIKKPHKFILSWKGSVRRTHLMSATCSSCYSLLNIPSSLGINSTTLLNITIRQNHYFLYTRAAFFRISFRVSSSLSFWVYRRLSTCWVYFISQLRDIFCMLYFASPFSRLFYDIGSYRYTLSLLLVLKSLSV